MACKECKKKAETIRNLKVDYDLLKQVLVDISYDLERFVTAHQKRSREMRKGL